MYAAALYSAVMLLTFHSVLEGIMVDPLKTLAARDFEPDGTRRFKQQSLKLERRAVSR